MENIISMLQNKALTADDKKFIADMLLLASLSSDDNGEVDNVISIRDFIDVYAIDVATMFDTETHEYIVSVYADFFTTDNNDFCGAVYFRLSSIKVYMHGGDAITQYLCNYIGVLDMH